MSNDSHFPLIIIYTDNPASDPSGPAKRRIEPSQNWVNHEMVVVRAPDKIDFGRGFRVIQTMVKIL